jgi:hypothetical protein
MSVINNLFIPCVDASYPAHDLIDAFYLSGIATVSEVDYEPYIDEDCLYNRAYLEVHEWHDTEAAYEFIKSLRIYDNETIYRNDRVAFVVQINDEPWMVPLSKCYRTISTLIHNSSGTVETSVCQDEEEYDYEEEQEQEDWVDQWMVAPLSNCYRTISTLINNSFDNLETSGCQDEEYDSYEQDEEQDEEDEEQDDEQDEEQDEAAREEYEYWLEQEDFIQEAKYYHEEVMEERLKNKKIMTDKQFREWEIISGFGKSKKECEYEVYLRTGNVC